MMKKITWVALLAICTLAVLSANGKEDQLYANPGPGYGRMWNESAEIQSVEGILEEGDYGHLEIVNGSKHYILGHEDMFNQEFLEDYLGKDALLEGFEGPVMFTREEEEYQMFHALKVSINGETLELDGHMMWGGRRGMRGPGRRGHCF